MPTTVVDPAERYHNWLDENQPLNVCYDACLPWTVIGQGEKGAERSRSWINALVSLGPGGLSHFQGAVLKIYVMGRVGNPENGLAWAIQRCTRYDWNIGYLCWQRYKSGTDWTAAGGDVDATGKATFQGPAATGWLEIIIDNNTGVSLVRDAVADHGGELNAILFEDLADTSYAFYTCHYDAYPPYKPKIIVTHGWFTPDPVAIPAVAPTITIERLLTPDPVAIPAAYPAIEVILGGVAVEIEPDPVAIPAVVPTLTVDLGLAVDPVAAAMATPDAQVELSITPASVTMPLAVPAPTIELTLLPTPGVCSAAVPDLAVDRGLAVSPVVLVLALPEIDVHIIGKVLAVLGRDDTLITIGGLMAAIEVLGRADNLVQAQGRDDTTVSKGGRADTTVQVQGRDDTAVAVGGRR